MRSILLAVVRAVVRQPPFTSDSRSAHAPYRVGLRISSVQLAEPSCVHPIKSPAVFFLIDPSSSALRPRTVLKAHDFYCLIAWRWGIFDLHCTCEREGFLDCTISEACGRLVSRRCQLFAFRTPEERALGACGRCRHPTHRHRFHLIRGLLSHL